jgi:hypothetical protein
MTIDNVAWLRRVQDSQWSKGCTAGYKLKDCADELERLRERVAEYEHSIRRMNATLNPQEVAIDKGWEAEDVLTDVLDGFAGRTENET